MRRLARLAEPRFLIQGPQARPARCRSRWVEERARGSPRRFLFESVQGFHHQRICRLEFRALRR